MFFNRLSESDADFMIGQSNHQVPTTKKTNAVDEGTSSSNFTGPFRVNNPQVDMHTLEENIVSKVRSEVDRLCDKNGLN